MQEEVENRSITLAINTAKLTAAFTEYTAKTLRHTEKPSLLAQLKKLTAPARSAPARAKDRDLTL